MTVTTSVRTSEALDCFMMLLHACSYIATIRPDIQMRSGLGLLQYDGLCISLPVNSTSIGFIHNCEAVLSFCITYVN